MTTMMWGNNLAHQYQLKHLTHNLIMGYGCMILRFFVSAGGNCP